MQSNISDNQTKFTTESYLEGTKGSRGKEKPATDFNIVEFDWSPKASPTLKTKSQQQATAKDDGRSRAVSVFDDFEKMGLCEEVLRGVFAYGFEKPSAIQQQAIVPCIQGKDVVAQAQSGTGKTATFTIAMLERIDITKKCCQVCNY